MKKFILIVLFSILLVGCSSSNDYIPTAIISNIDYNENNLDLEFQLEIVDKSETITEVIIELYNDEESITAQYNSSQYLYSFENILNNKQYHIKIVVSYVYNDVLLENKEILNLDITNYLSTDEIYFPSQTYLYTGDSYSIYLANVNDSYNVVYKGNNQSEVGIHEVIAELYLNNKLIETYTAYLIITNNKVELIANNQIHTYTTNPIAVEYHVSNNAFVEINYYNNDVLIDTPTEVGQYKVVLSVEDITIEVIMIIKKAEIEILSTSKTVEYDGKSHSIDVLTNIDVEYSITYNNSNIMPIEVGIYNVIISVEDTSNYNGCVKHLTLTITDDSSSLEEIFISQIIFINDNEVLIELYNPTNKIIDLSTYSISLGLIENNKIISLSGTINSYSTFTIVSSSISLTNTFDFYSNYLIMNNTETISLYNTNLVDQFILNKQLNYIRKAEIEIPNSQFDINEWIIENEINSLNSHICEKELLNYSVSFSNTNLLNINDQYDLNDYIFIYNNDIKITLSNDMIIENTIDVTKFGSYKVLIKVETFEFEINFTVTDTQPPVFSVNTNSLVFNVNEEIDYLSLITVVDNTDSNISVNYTTNVDITKEGIYNVNYVAYDKYGNLSNYTLYIFIES